MTDCVLRSDRSNEEFTEGQEMSKKHTGVENTTIVDREQLMDRTQKTKQHENGNITSIEDLRRRRLGGNLPNVPLANRKSLRDVNKEDTPTTIEHSDMHNTEPTDHSQGGQLSERRSLVRSVDRDVSQD